MDHKSILKRLKPFIKALLADKKIFQLILFLTILCGHFLFVLKVSAEVSYPKLANYFLKTPISTVEMSELAKWDIVILGMQVVDTNPDIFNTLRALNPDIKIIAYLSAMEFPVSRYQTLESASGPWHKMYAGIKNEWWLADSQGGKHSVWPGNWSLNVTDYCPNIAGQKFNTFLPQFIKNELIRGGLWDGVFFDNVLDGIKFTNNGLVDINNDGKIDEKNWVDNEWRNAMKNMLNKTRQLLGNDKIIIVNSSSYALESINGRLYETWPSIWYGGWTGEMNDYKKLENKIRYWPQTIILNPNTENSGAWQNFQKVRFGLASTLLGNGYFAFDFGDSDHSQTWWYDEYNIDLGIPLNEATNLLTGKKLNFEPGVWRRDFSSGVVLVNSTNKTQTIDLGSGIYEKIRGQQDPITNNGQLVRKISLASEDGIILLKKLELTESQTDFLKGVSFTNGDFVRVFDKKGKNKRAGFYAYNPSFKGGEKILVEDLNLDGENEILVADDSQIKIFKASGLLLNSFHPYGPNYNSGINFAVGNIQGDSLKEIVTGTGVGGGPHVKVFNCQGQELNKGWFAYDKNFRGGVQVALGDLNGNGYKEIITGAGFGGGPHVRIFDASGYPFDPGFFAYDPFFRGGVNVTCADLNGDSKSEIITGAGIGGGPHIRIFDKIGHLVDPGFFAFDESKRNGVKVAAQDIDTDGEVEILGME